jgi:hypothetical protein
MYLLDQLVILALIQSYLVVFVHNLLTQLLKCSIAFLQFQILFLEVLLQVLKLFLLFNQRDGDGIASVHLFDHCLFIKLQLIVDLAL